MSNPIIIDQPANPPENALVEPPAVETSPAVETPPAHADSVPWDRYAEVQREAAERRVQLKEYNELFDGFDDDGKAAWRQMIQLAKDGSPEAIKAVADAFGLQVPEDAYQPQYLTQQQVQDMLDARDAQFQEQQAIDGVYRQAEALGYERNTEQMVRLLWHLNNMETPDIKAADKAIKDHEAKVISDYIAKKGAQAGAVPQQPDAGGSAPPTDAAPPKTPREASAAARARFAAARAANGQFV